MRKLVFVDDEASLRQSITSIVDWHAFNFELVGVASNGQEALSIIEETHPDVVITDICMPIMDGFELSQEIYKFDPTIKIIFLSGHDNFDFAQSAIRLNIHEYLLKPISLTDLQTALEHINESFSLAERQAVDAIHMTQQYMHELAASRRSMLFRLITDAFTSYDELKLRNLVDLYQLNIPDQDHLIATIHYPPQLTGNSIEAISDDARDILFAEELTWISYHQTLLEICEKYLNAEIFRHNQQSVLILSDIELKNSEKLDLLLQDIQQTLLRRFRLQTTIGISNISNHLYDLRILYRQAVQSLDFALSDDNALNRAHYSDLAYDMEVRPFELTPQMEDRFISLIKIARYPDFEVYIRRLYRIFHEQPRTYEACYLMFLELTSRMLRILQPVNPSISLPLNRFMEAMIHLEKATPEIVLSTFLEYSERFFEMIQATRSSTKESLTEQGLRIIRQRYADPLFSQKECAETLHISPNYLSSLFTKETKKSFKEHLISARMEKAKELLLSTNMKVLEISIATGYTDQHYFSYSFKRYFKISPRKMRELHAAADECPDTDDTL